MTAVTEKIQFRGLNSLRFFAAFLVVIGHIPLNQESVGLPHPSNAAVFFRGAPAVYFFFVLSGFLITYILLQERERTGTINIGNFYLRRILRIWPVYFSIIGFGLFFYNVLLPMFGIPYRIEYQIWLAVTFYAFFLPNLMNSLYSVSGILNPSWSIGIEEQFYLVWAPVTRYFHDRLPLVCWAVLFAFLLVFCLEENNVFGLEAGKRFSGQLKFHFIAAGALAAWYLHRRREAFLGASCFANRFVQFLLLALLLDFVILSTISWGWFMTEVVQLVLYTWLVVNVAANPRSIVPVGHRVTEYLGKISYGIYMFHMIAVYATSQVFKSTTWWRDSLPLYCVAYYALVFGLVILIAGLSYRFFETPFLRLKDRLHSQNALTR